MAIKMAYRCRDCHHVKAVKWRMRCPGCGGFFNIEMVPAANVDGGGEAVEPEDGDVMTLRDAINCAVEVPRIKTGIDAIDHVLGGGFARNGIYLLCGDPGAGKTTVVLQSFLAISKQKHPTLYVTGEQTISDVALRARSFGKFPARMMVTRETDLYGILDTIDDNEPEVVAIDSAQTLYIDDDYEVGSAATIKKAIRELTEYAKERKVAIVIIGHVTKGGGIAGPRTLEHYVDCNLYLSGNKFSQVRVLRCDSKNRYGETPREARFVMTEHGLVPAPPEEPPED